VNRNKQGGAEMDKLDYAYSRDANGRLVSNRLNSVTDSNTTSSETGELQGTSNYTYDAIGNLTADSKEGISSIGWSVYGKIKNIAKANSNISYTYDPSGNRVSKIFTETVNGVTKTTTSWYVRDAQGNQLALYDNKETAIKWKEQNLYGSSRLGMWKPNFKLAVDSGALAWAETGRKFFEETNHLGNTMAVISDKRTLVGGVYVADIINANDYYAFGSQMPGRSFTETGATAYKYGFNGKENDNEVKGAGNQQDYGMRIYDPRIGRFLSVDPLHRNFPWWTPYQFAGNTPIQAVDLDGAEILLPRIIPFPLEPVLSLPKVPAIPVPTGEMLLPPILPNLPNGLTVGQPKNPSIDKAEEFDWSKVDRAKPDTWPEPPFSGERKVGEPSKQKPKERGEKSWYDENDGEWRPHTPDKYHPKGHWDYKPAGEKSQWENIYQLNDIIIKPLPKSKNYFEKVWEGIKDFFKADPPDPRDDPFYT